MKMTGLMLATLLVAVLFIGSLSGLAYAQENDNSQEDERNFRYRLVGHGIALYGWIWIETMEVTINTFMEEDGTFGGWNAVLMHIVWQDYDFYSFSKEPVVYFEVNEDTREVWYVLEGDRTGGPEPDHWTICYIKDGGPNGEDLFTGQTAPVDSRDEAIDLCKTRPNFYEVIWWYPEWWYGISEPMPLLRGNFNLIVYSD